MIFGVDVASMLLGGVAAGMVLFIVSVGLSVTMGLMGFVNLAHGGFAMLGGYAIALAMKQWGFGFGTALVFGFVVTAAASAALERLLYARLYRATDLDQVLFTIGLVFMMIASVTLLVGPENQPLALPAMLRGQINLGFMRYRTYSVVLIVIDPETRDIVMNEYLSEVVMVNGKLHQKVIGQIDHVKDVCKAEKIGPCAPK